MFKIIAIILQAAGVGAGVYFGMKMKAPPAAIVSTDDGHGEHAEGDGHGDDKKGKGDHGKSDGHGDDSDYGFLKFSRPFIVPVMDGDESDSLVVIDINLEMPPSTTETSYALEPKLRDAILRSLLALSNEGAFSGRLLEEENLDGVRTRLLEAAKNHSW